MIIVAIIIIRSRIWYLPGKGVNPNPSTVKGVWGSIKFHSKLGKSPPPYKIEGYQRIKH